MITNLVFYLTKKNINIANGYGSYIQANLNSTQTSQTYNSPMFGYSINSSNLEDAKLLRQLKMQALKVLIFSSWINELKILIRTVNFLILFNK